MPATNLAAPAARPARAAALIALALIAAPRLEASDPIGVYALVDRVELEPADGPAERIRLHGVFCRARGVGLGDYYETPTRGQLFYRLPESSPELARDQWRDMQSIAGTGAVVGFGSRWEGGAGTIHAPGDRADVPDAYPLHMELRRLPNDHPSARILRQTPAPTSPAEGAVVAPGPTTLEAEVPWEWSAEDRFVFVVETARGELCVSPPLAAEPRESVAGDADESAAVAPAEPRRDARVRWSPPLVLFPGESVTWRALRLPDADGHRVGSRLGGAAIVGPGATARFRVGVDDPPFWARDGR